MSFIYQPVNLSAASIQGTLPVVHGGTGLTNAFTGSTLNVVNGGTGTASYTNGQLLIGNTLGNTLTPATLTAGSNIAITNGNGSITIASTAAGGAEGYVLQATGINAPPGSGNPTDSYGII